MIRALFAAVWIIVQIWLSLSGCSNRGAGSVAATREAAERSLRPKGLEPTSEAVALLHGLTRSPYAVSRALAALGDEPAGRELALDEVRFALSHLDEDRLWRRDATPTHQAGLKVLLEADIPLSQAELARRGDFSTQSWRNNREVLVDADLMRETVEGWRLALPFREERHATGIGDHDREASADVGDEDHVDYTDHHGDPRPPWFVRERSDRLGILDRAHRRPLDVLQELVEERLPANERNRLLDPEDTLGQIAAGYSDACADLGDVVEEVLHEIDLGIVWPIILASCGIRDGHGPVVNRSLMGPSIAQQTIDDTVTG